MGGIFQWPELGDAGGGPAAGASLEAQVAALRKIVWDFILPRLASLAPDDFLDYGPGVSTDAPLHGGSAAELPPPWMPPFHADPVTSGISGGVAATAVPSAPEYGPIGVCRVIAARYAGGIDIQVMESISGLSSGATFRKVSIPAKVDNPAVGDWGQAWRVADGSVVFFPESQSVDAASAGLPSDCSAYSEYVYTTSWSGLECGGSTAGASCAQADQSSMCAWTPDGPGNIDLTVQTVDKGSGSPRYVWRATLTHGAVNGTVSETYEKAATTTSTPDGMYTRTTSNCADAPETITIWTGSCP